VSGFKHAVVSGVVLEVGERDRIDIKLEFGALSPTMPPGYIWQWSFNVQRQLRSKLVLEVG
jgi:hypothetical protein